MSRLNSLLRRLASPKDRELLDRNPALEVRLRILARIGLRFWWAYLGILVLLAMGTVSAGMDVYHRTEQPQFCGGCHEMGQNFDTWNVSRHKDITCADCHAQPGLLGWVKAKTAGLKQLRVHFTATNISGIRIESNQRTIISDNCSRCHAGLARLGERLGLGVSHRQHLEKGLACITCHTGAFTHPGNRKAAAGGAADGGTTVAEKPAAPKHETDAKGAFEAQFVEVAVCFQCHDGKTKQNDTVVFSAQDETKCLKCHPDAEQAAAHGARSRRGADRKPCLDCHELEKDNAHYQVPTDVGPMCAKCHEQEKHPSKLHQPYRSGECAECHRVMSPTYLFKFGPRPTNTLCIHCHDEIKAVLGAEPVGETDLTDFSDGTTDLHQKHAQELSKKSNDWCFDCHAPHGSDAPKALIRLREPLNAKTTGTFEKKDPGGACTSACHEKKGKLTYAGPGE